MRYEVFKTPIQFFYLFTRLDTACLGLLDVSTTKDWHNSLQQHEDRSHWHLVPNSL